MSLALFVTLSLVALVAIYALNWHVRNYVPLYGNNTAIPNIWFSALFIAGANWVAWATTDGSRLLCGILAAVLLLIINSNSLELLSEKARR